MRERLWPGCLGRLVILFVIFAAGANARADALPTVQLLREGGCGGILPAARPLRHSALLDRAAELWADGYAVSAAAEGSGYRGAQATAALHLSGPDSSLVELIGRTGCRTLASQNLRDIGIYQRGSDTWLVLASTYGVPISSRGAASSQGAALASRAVQLVNEVRSRGTRCGQHWFPAVPPVTLSETLAQVASAHAVDMAEHDYFEHEDLLGQSPAQRVRAVGYREKLVGENIAYGRMSVDEVVQGWLDSPGHCENIMDRRFAQMGIGYAAGQASKRGLYWVQLLVAPQT